MKLYTALFAATLLPGCIASTQGQAMQKNQEMQSVDQSYALCKSAVDSTPEAMRLTEFFMLGQKRDTNYLEKTTNNSYATDQQIADVQKYRDSLKVCRVKAVSDLKKVNADYAILVDDYFKEDDKISDDVMNRKITIGEANRKATKTAYFYSLKDYDFNAVVATQ